MKPIYHPPRLERARLVCGAVAAVLALLLFLAVPFTQLLAGFELPSQAMRSKDMVLPPPDAPPPDPPPPPEEEIEEVKPEMDRETPPLDLSQLDVALNPGTGDALAGGFSVANFGVTPDSLAEMRIFEVQELDAPPRPVSRVSPTYPYNLRREGVTGSVRLIVVIDESGNVVEATVQTSSHRDFERPAVEAALRWRFTPPTRNGVPVRARYFFPLSFTLGG